MRQRAAERQRAVMQLRIRGLSFDAIGKQIGCSQHIAFKVYRKALRAIVHPAVEEFRKLEAERIADLRQRIWSEMAGRPDPNDPTKTIRPDPGLLVDLVDKAIKISRHEAMVFGYDAPSKSEIASQVISRPISDAEMDEQLARLTQEEQDEFMRLCRKMAGRGLEAEPSIETTASPIAATGEIEVAKGNGNSNA